MKIGLVANIFKDKNYSLTCKIIKWFNEKNITPYISFDIESYNYKINYINVDQGEMIKEIDNLIVIGGDGTLLGIAGLASLHNVPIMGVNLGTVGFLTTVETYEIESALEKLINKDYVIEERIMLETTIENNGNQEKVIALNDLVVAKGLMSKLISLEISINDTFIGVIRGDGLIVATPTGSTAYNLSAKGPILKPTSNILAVTPICAQSMFGGPFVISASEKVTVKVSYRSNNDVALTADGSIVKYISNGEKLTFFASEHKTKLLNINDTNFFDLLRKKLANID